MTNDIRDEYFDWLCRVIDEPRHAGEVSYVKLLSYLHSVEFTYLIPKDENRAVDGIGMRYHFAVANGYKEMSDLVCDILDGPCSVFEMMVALAIRYEQWMDDPCYGDRTGRWFWDMIVSLGLGEMHARNFDKRYVEDTIQRFLNRDYEPNGKGGLFTIKNPDCDLRDVEIWYQMCRSMNTNL